MTAPSRAARALAEAFAIGPWESASLRALGAEVLGQRQRWVGTIVSAVMREFSAPPADDAGLAAVAAFITDHRSFQVAYFQPEPPHVRRWLFRPPSMGMTPWPVPPAATVLELAEVLEIDPQELEWLADTRRYLQRARSPRLAHYHCTWLRKRGGGFRLIERPKPLIKLVQRRVLRRILDVIPPHERAEGFVRGRSPLSHASRHVGSAALLCLDLEDFFTSIPFGRVYRVFRAAGYPVSVARALAGLCTTALPVVELARLPRPALASEVSHHQRLRRNALRRHLPQGAPTSPALANLCALGLDRRLHAAARAGGLEYSRYADDLAFSGGGAFPPRARDFAALAAAIAIDEGFSVNFRKTRITRQSARQRVCGVVVNDHPNVPRADYDRLEAILTNCVRSGAASQNREGLADFRGHLRGRIGWVEAIAPAKGAKLARLFEAIDWDG